MSATTFTDDIYLTGQAEQLLELMPQITKDRHGSNTGQNDYSHTETLNRMRSSDLYAYNGLAALAHSTEHSQPPDDRQKEKN